MTRALRVTFCDLQISGNTVVLFSKAGLINRCAFKIFIDFLGYKHTNTQTYLLLMFFFVFFAVFSKHDDERVKTLEAGFGQSLSNLFWGNWFNNGRKKNSRETRYDVIQASDSSSTMVTPDAPPPPPWFLLISLPSCYLLSGDSASFISSSSTTTRLYKGKLLTKARGELFVYLHSVCKRHHIHIQQMFLPSASYHRIQYPSKQNDSMPENPDSMNNLLI